MGRGISSVLKSASARFATISIALIFIFIAGGCQKSPINGDLDGQWQICEVTPTPQEEIIKRKLYYCFYMHTCQLTSPGYTFIRGNFTYDGNTIMIDFPSYDDEPESTIATMRQYGIYSNPVTFNIKFLDSEKLIIENPDATITLRKF